MFGWREKVDEVGNYCLVVGAEWQQYWLRVSFVVIRLGIKKCHAHKFF
jgi:hypothetical protein